MARWDAKRKLKRNRTLLGYYASQPSLSLREVGEMFGVSRQRVWELVKLEEKRRMKKLERRAV